MPRVWDRFLTEEDSAHLRAVGGPQLRRPGKVPALLLVDLYRWVFGDEPQPLLDAVRTWEASCGPAGWQALPHIRRLLDEARKARIHIIHIVDTDDVADWGVSDDKSSGDRDARRTERLSRRYDIMPDVQPLAGEVVLRKAAPSAFWGTPLVAHLNALGVDTVITAGESTSGCVRATVVDGRSYRYHMVVPEECVFDRHVTSHAVSLFDMQQKYAAVMSLDDVCSYIRNLPRSASNT